MRIAFRDFESIRKDPKLFAEAALAGKKNKFSPSKFQAFKDGISAYHNNNNSLTSGNDYLKERFPLRFAQNKQNKQELEHYINCMSDYHESYKTLSYPEIKKRPRLEVTINKDDSIYGQASKIHLDTNSHSFEIYFIEKKTYGWQQELKFPLIQYQFAKNHEVDINEIAVGIYSLDKAFHEFKCYDKNEIEEALNEAKSVIKDYKKLIK